MTYQFHRENTHPTGAWIWVFPSNEAGKHTKGLAKMARMNFRAVFGCARGPTGNAYALPTHDRRMQLLPLATIEGNVADFLQYASLHKELNFFVTRIAGAHGEYGDDVMGPLFACASENCSLPDAWIGYVAQARAHPTSPSAPSAHSSHAKVSLPLTPGRRSQ